MKGPHPLLFWLYRCALVIYPLRLRSAYRDQMLQTLRDSYRDHSSGSLRFWRRAFTDLLKSSLTERFYMARDQFIHNPVLFHTLALALAITLLGGTATMVIDQMMRGPSRIGGNLDAFYGANQPQIEMVNWYAGEINAGEKPDDVIPPGYVDLERSLQPFVIFYDDHGRPVKGTGYLDQKLPAPPPGVFDFVHQHGIEKVTWQPQPGVRLATVVRRVNGKTPGFVLAARSLRLVEEQKTVLWRMALGIWITVMALLFGGAALLQRTQRAKQSSA
jgi:hypothetical protein